VVRDNTDVLDRLAVDVQDRVVKAPAAGVVTPMVVLFRAKPEKAEWLDPPAIDVLPMVIGKPTTAEAAMAAVTKAVVATDIELSVGDGVGVRGGIGKYTPALSASVMLVTVSVDIYKSSIKQQTSPGQ